MLRLFFVTFIFVSANCCNPTLPPNVCKFFNCNVIKLLSASSNSTITKCINEQTGLMATIEKLRAPDSGWSAVIIADLLDKNGHATKATAFRKCVAKQNGMLNSDGTYNMDILNSLILIAIGNTECLANTKVGLQKCPAVAKYDVNNYLQCVANYCTNYVTTG